MSDLLETLPCGVVSFGDDGHITYANRTLGTLLGHAPDALVGRHLESLLTISGRIFYQTHLFPLLRLHGKAEEVFLLFRRTDGTDVGALVNAVRRERDGVVVSDCVLLEVRERRKYEDELLRAKREAEEANVQLAARSREVQAANDQLVAQSRELELQHEQLQEQAVEMEAQGEELRMLNDELTTRSDELERSRDAADAANHAKSEFLARMSHDLRTPLNAIGGYAQLIEDGIYGVTTGAQLEALSRIRRAQQHLLTLINDILSFAKLEAGQVSLELLAVDVPALLDELRPLLEPQMEAKGLRFDVRLDDAAVIAVADRSRLAQILVNLLTNALKFTPAGGTVAVSCERATDTIAVRVRDSGVGISADRLDAIFSAFVQVGPDASTTNDGVGLGLAISRELARLMKGEITVESAAGRGSTFTVTLPAAREEALASAVPSPPALAAISPGVEPLPSPVPGTLLLPGSPTAASSPA